MDLACLEMVYASTYMAGAAASNDARSCGRCEIRQHRRTRSASDGFRIVRRVDKARGRFDRICRTALYHLLITSAACRVFWNVGRMHLRPANQPTPLPDFHPFYACASLAHNKKQKGGFDDDIRLRWSPHQNDSCDRFVGHDSAAGLRAGPEV